MKNLNKIFLTLLVLSGCIKQPKSKTKRKKNNLYTLHVDGVECAQCAKKAVVALEGVAEIGYAEYVCNDREYKDCFARAYTIGKYKLPICSVREKLKPLGFDLEGAKGRFVGKFSKSRLEVNVAGRNYPIRIFESQFKKYRGKKKTFNGRLIIKDGMEWFEVL